MPLLLKKPVTVVKSIRFDGTNFDEVRAWLERHVPGTLPVPVDHTIILDETGALRVLDDAAVAESFQPIPEPES